MNDEVVPATQAGREHACADPSCIVCAPGNWCRLHEDWDDCAKAWGAGHLSDCNDAECECDCHAWLMKARRTGREHPVMIEPCGDLDCLYPHPRDTAREAAMTEERLCGAALPIVTRPPITCARSSGHRGRHRAHGVTWDEPKSARVLLPQEGGPAA